MRAPRAAREAWWTTFPAVAAVTVAMSSDANQWLHDLIASMPANLDDIRPVQAFLDRLGQERPRFIRAKQLGSDLLRLISRGHIADPAAVSRLGSAKAVRDSIADALAGYTTLDVGPTTTRAARYEKRSQVSVEALSVPTVVMAAVVGNERLQQLARELSARV